MFMNVGEVLLIKNKAGILKARVEKRLSLEEVSKSVGDDKLPAFSRPRLEYHAGPYGEHLVTLCDENDKLPFNLYVLSYDICVGVPQIYLAVVDKTEERAFETVY
jgi:hypothetical protein